MARKYYATIRWARRGSEGAWAAEWLGYAAGE
jgi:hypothetical protein